MKELTQMNLKDLRAMAEQMVAIGSRALQLLDSLPANSNRLMALHISEPSVSTHEKLRQIALLVAARHGFLMRRMLSPERTEELARARQECFWLARRLTSGTFTAIGAFFNRDHGTVMYGCKAVEDYRSVDAEYAAWLDGLLAELPQLLAEKTED